MPRLDLQLHRVSKERATIRRRRRWIWGRGAVVAVGLSLTTHGFSQPFGFLRGAPGVPPDAGQLLVAIADQWDSHRAKLWCFERGRDGGWISSSVGGPISVLLGRRGLAWGIGVSRNPRGDRKMEGDGKTPAGVFALGTIYGYAAGLPPGSDPDYPYNQVTERDAWVDDPESRFYNRHVELRPGQAPPPWFESQRMRLGDPAYEFRIEVRHNSDPPKPGLGSVIFFHIRRGPDRPSAGCTTMARADLIRIIRWLRDEKNPHYVILPEVEYRRWTRSWDLPVFARDGRR